MKHTAILQSICAHYHKERRFWYLNSYAKIVDVVAYAKQQVENGRPPRKVKIASYISLWGNIQYIKKYDALLDVLN